MAYCEKHWATWPGVASSLPAVTRSYQVFQTSLTAAENSLAESQLGDTQIEGDCLRRNLSAGKINPDVSAHPLPSWLRQEMAAREARGARRERWRQPAVPECDGHVFSLPCTLPRVSIWRQILRLSCHRDVERVLPWKWKAREHCAGSGVWNWWVMGKERNAPNMSSLIVY